MSLSVSTALLDQNLGDLDPEVTTAAHFADLVTTTTHKTLGGPRGGVVLCTKELAKKVDSTAFPGQQGGPLLHVIAAKAVAFKVAASEEFRERRQRVLEGAALRPGFDETVEADLSARVASLAKNNPLYSHL